MDSPVSSERVLAVLGSLVFDTLHRWPPDQPPVEAWGGVGHALAALEVALADGWTQRLLVKVGGDMAAEAEALRREWARTCASSGFVAVGGVRTNRVTIRYHGPEERDEVQLAEMPPWTGEAVLERLVGVEALYLNFASGFELPLEEAERVRAGFAGGIYLDLHSLNLGIEPDGHRYLRRPPDLARWLACADVAHFNLAEAALVGPAPTAALEAASAVGLGAVVVTSGVDGATIWTQPGWRFGRRGVAGRTFEPHHLPALDPEGATDPTGCGDVFGAAMAARLAAGDAPLEALRAATTLASAAARWSGAGGLGAWLKGRTGA